MRFDKPSFKYLGGLRFGRLIAMQLSGWSDSGCHRMWDCICDCGKLVRCAAHQLLGGKTKSCGCYARDTARQRLTTHGERIGGSSPTPEYNAWKNLHQRCSNPKRRDYKRYGGRGIKVCASWGNFSAFLKDMGRRPGPSYSVERGNNDGNYEPGNCRWATRKEQCRNRTSTKTVQFLGRLMSLAEAAELAGLPYTVVRARYYRLKWPIDECLNRPHRYAGRGVEVRL